MQNIAMSACTNWRGYRPRAHCSHVKETRMASRPQHRFPRSQRGQGMTEYIIIVALIAVAAIAV